MKLKRRSMLTMINSKKKQNNRDTSLGKKKEALSMGILAMLRKCREREGSFRSHDYILCLFSRVKEIHIGLNSSTLSGFYLLFLLNYIDVLSLVIVRSIAIITIVVPRDDE